MGYTPGASFTFPLSPSNNSTTNPTGAMTYGTIQNNWDALMEDFDAVAYLPFGDEYWDAMNQIMNAVGNREIAKNPKVRWFEMTRMEAPLSVSSATGSTGGPFTVTLDSAYSQTVGGTAYSFPAAGDIWRDASTGALYQITAKASATSVTMKPLLSTSVAPAGLMFYVGNSAPENGGSYASKFVFDTVHTSPLQTFRNDTTSSSEALYNQLWYSQLENGVQTPYSNSRDIIYLQREHQVALVNTFFAGVPSTDSNYNTGLTTTSFQTTQGLLNAIQTNGSLNNGGSSTVISIGSPVAGFDVTDMYAMESALTSQDGSVKNYMVWTSGAMQATIEQGLFGATTNTAGANNPFNLNVQVNKVQMEKTFWGEGAYADLMSKTYSFNNVVFNNKNFGFVRMGVFDNPTMFGVGADAAANAWKSYAFFIPLSTNGGVDDGIGNMGKYIRLAHKPGAFMNMWQTGGRAAANKTDVWQLGVHIVSEVAYKFVNANKYGLFTA
jgi:hypothetical protein